MTSSVATIVRKSVTNGGRSERSGHFHVERLPHPDREAWSVTTAGPGRAPVEVRIARMSAATSQGTPRIDDREDRSSAMVRGSPIANSRPGSATSCATLEDARSRHRRTGDTPGQLGEPAGLSALRNETEDGLTRTIPVATKKTVEIHARSVPRRRERVADEDREQDRGPITIWSCSGRTVRNWGGRGPTT